MERDLIPVAREMGLGAVGWSPLASGVLTGKYARADLDGRAEGSAGEGTRRDVAAGNGSLTERAMAIADVVKEVAAELGRPPSQLALPQTRGIMSGGLRIEGRAEPSGRPA